MKRTCVYVLLSVLVLLFPVNSYMQAQETTGTIEGIIQDRSGGVVPNAKIILIRQETNEKKVFTTDGSGRFAFPDLSVGTYRLTAERAGYRTYTQTDIRLRVTEHLNIPITLEVGTATEEITVQAAATTVDTKSSAIGQVIETKQLSDLPLNGRNFLQLATLVPGSVPAIGYSEPGTPQTEGGVTSAPQVNGSRTEANAYLLDGADNSEPFLGSAAAVPSVEAIQEFKIQSSLYSAEFGSGGGAILNVITKSGSNALHGAVYDFLRNDAMDARNYFSTKVPILKRNQFGFTLGGPIWPNKTFFFVNYEGLRESSAPTRTASVPSLLEREGNFSQSAAKPVDPATGLPFPQDTIPDNMISSIAENLLAFYPTPNVGSNLFNSSPSEPKRIDQFMVKLDHRIGDKDQVSARYLFEDGDRTFHFVPTFLGSLDVPNFPATDVYRFQNFVVSNTYSFSQRLVNETRFSYNRAAMIAAEPQYKDDAQQIGFTFPVTQSYHNIPLVGVSGLTAIGTSNFDASITKYNNIFTFEDNISLAHGRHLIKAGFHTAFAHVDSTAMIAYDGAYDVSGAFSGNPFADLLLGMPLFFIQIGGDPSRQFRSSAFAYFVEDSFSINRHLTLNFGLRHELFTPIFDTQGRMASFRPGEQSVVRPYVPPDVVYPGDPGVPRSTYPRVNKNLGPRVGIAWDPLGDGKTSVRAGYGIYYNPPLTFVAFQTSVAPAITGTVSVFAPNFADPFNGSSPFVPGATVIPVTPGTQVNYMDPNLRTPYTQQYNFGVQRQIAKDYVLQIGYVGSVGTHLLGTVEMNPPVYIPGGSTAYNINARRPYQPWGQVFEQSAGSSSNYNSLQTSLTKNFSKGLSLLVSYTWSKSIDHVSVPQQYQSVDGQPPNVIAANPRDLNAERAVSAFNVPQRIVTSFSWELPFFKNLQGAPKKVLYGWQCNGIVQVQSGTPFTVYDPSDPNVDGETSDRPDLVGNPYPPGFHRSVQEDFNTAAFKRTPYGSDQFGTAGRNLLRSHRFANVDFSLFKNIPVTDRINVQFRGEIFNLFNHANFGAPVSDITSASFGQIINTLPNSERKIQLGLRLWF